MQRTKKFKHFRDMYWLCGGERERAARVWGRSLLYPSAVVFDSAVLLPSMFSESIGVPPPRPLAVSKRSLLLSFFFSFFLPSPVLRTCMPCSICDGGTRDVTYTLRAGVLEEGLGLDASEVQQCCRGLKRAPGFFFSFAFETEDSGRGFDAVGHRSLGLHEESVD